MQDNEKNSHHLFIVIVKQSLMKELPDRSLHPSVKGHGEVVPFTPSLHEWDVDVARIEAVRSMAACAPFGDR
jgi:hypothetical protein